MRHVVPRSKRLSNDRALFAASFKRASPDFFRPNALFQVVYSTAVVSPKPLLQPRNRYSGRDPPPSPWRYPSVLYPPLSETAHWRVTWTLLVIAGPHRSSRLNINLLSVRPRATSSRQRKFHRGRTIDVTRKQLEMLRALGNQHVVLLARDINKFGFRRIARLRQDTASTAASARPVAANRAHAKNNELSVSSSLEITERLSSVVHRRPAYPGRF